MNGTYVNVGYRKIASCLAKTMHVLHLDILEISYKGTGFIAREACGHKNLHSPHHEANLEILMCSFGKRRGRLLDCWRNVSTSRATGEEQ